MVIEYEERDAEILALAERARAGDRRALDDLMVRLQPLVMRRCARFLPCREDAEEAAQDALIAIATKLSSFSGTGSFIGWVTVCLLYTSPSPRDRTRSRMPSSA